MDKIGGKMLLLILRLEAPLMRWGLHSQWNDRDTHVVPTKSAIIGLISCAMGLPRKSERIVELSRQLEIGVRADRKGVPMTDLQIVSQDSNHRIKNLCAANYKPRTGEGGLLTYRHYLQDASFTVVLSSKNEQLLHQVSEAVQNPVFPIYSGAKSCVFSRQVFEDLSDAYLSIEDALAKYPIAPKRSRDKTQEKYYCEIEDKQGSHIRQDEIQLNEMREYDFRRVTIKYIGG